MPDGPGRAELLSNCMTCHSSRYVAGQPRLSRKTWQTEVEKMKSAYGAPVPPDDVPKIVDYLVATHGTE
jgi:hypothetical protein